MSWATYLTGSSIACAAVVWPSMAVLISVSTLPGSCAHPLTVDEKEARRSSGIATASVGSVFMKPAMSGTALLRTGAVWTRSTHHAVYCGDVTHLMYSHAACLTAGAAPLNIKRLSPVLPTTLLTGPAGSGAAPRLNMLPLADSTLWALALL